MTKKTETPKDVDPSKIPFGEKMRIRSETITPPSMLTDQIALRMASVSDLKKWLKDHTVDWVKIIGKDGNVAGWKVLLRVEFWLCWLDTFDHTLYMDTLDNQILYHTFLSPVLAQGVNVAMSKNFASERLSSEGDSEKK